MLVALLISGPANAQRAGVNITNQSFGRVELRVYDNTCRAVLYRGVLINNATTTVNCCTFRPGQCSLSIYDHNGHRHDYKGILATIFLRAR